MEARRTRWKREAGKLVELLAERGISLSNASFGRILGRIENFKKTKLLTRQRWNPVTMTKVGKAFLRTMGSAVKPYLLALKQSPLDETPSMERLTLATENMFAVNFIPEAIRDFWKSFPDAAPTISFDIREVGTIHQALQELRYSETSMLLYSARSGGKRPAENITVSSKPLLLLKDVALIPKTRRFRKYVEMKGELSPEVLADETVCFVESGDVAIEGLSTGTSRPRVVLQTLGAVRQMALKNEIIGLSNNWLGALGDDWSEHWHLRTFKMKRKPLEVRLYSHVKPPLAGVSKLFFDFVEAAVSEEKKRLLEFRDGRPVAQ